MKKITLFFMVFCCLTISVQAQFIQQNGSIYGSRSLGVSNLQEPRPSLQNILERIQQANHAGVDQQQFTAAEREVLAAYLNSQNRSPQATLLTEEFDDITTLPGAGYSFVNASDAPGLTDWFQGNDAVFPAHQGAPTAYIGANYNNTGGSVINNFMITPILELENGDEITFWTRTATGSTFPDRLEVRIDPTGANTDPTGPSDVGSYTELLLEINPGLTVGGYPDTWTEFTATVTGLSGAVNTRVAFRYWVTDAGPSGNNSDYIGIDTLSIEEGSGGGGGEPTVYALNLRGSCGNDFGTFPLSGPFTIAPISTITSGIFAADFDGSGTLYGLNFDTLSLVTVDTGSGTETTVGPLTNLTGTPSGLAWNEADGTMYASSTDGTDTTIYSVDLSSGTCTVIGTSGNALGIWLAIDNSGNAFMADIGDDNLYSIDLSTGAGTLVGPLGIDISFAQDADFDPDSGVLYMAAYIGGGVNQFCSVDTTTGAVTQLGSINADCAEIGMLAIQGTGGGGGGGVCGNPILEINQDVDDTCMANISQGGLAQSYIPTEPEAAGAGIKFRDPSTGLDVTLSLWDGLPNGGGTMLATATTQTDGTVWADVYWDPVVNVTVGTTYYIVIEGDPTLPCVAGSTNDPYPDGNTFANNYNSFPTFDYTFRTYSCDGGGGPNCSSTAYDSTAVPFDIDGSGTSTADCTNAPNLIPITVSEAGTIGTDAIFENITIDIAHTWSSDLDLYLVSPNGTELLLAEDLGGSTDDAYNGTMFEDGGADITVASAPFGVGPYEPMGGTFANAFAGEDITGVWNLKVCDDSGGDTGQVLQFSMSICVPPVITNDDCSNAYALACGDSVTGETITASDSGGNPAPDVFYKFTGSGAPQLVTISLCGGGTDYDSALRVFDDCDLQNELAFNDDSCGLQSEVTFVSDGTSTYYIMVEGFSSNSGNFSLDVSCSDPLPNDDCSGAIAVSCGDSVSGSTVGATVDSNTPNCGPNITSPGVWYTLNDDTGLPGDITLSLCNGTDFDSKISVYTGTCGALVCVDGNDDACGLQSEITFASDGNTQYYILIHSFGGATGNFTLDVTCTPTPPPNDMIVNSIDVDEIGFPYTDPAVAMPAATPENGNPDGCDLTGAYGVWYNFVAAADGTANATIVTPGGASSVTFYTAPDENATETDLTLVPQNTNQCVPGTTASIYTLGGQAYYVFVMNTGAITDIVIDGTNLGVADNTIEGFSYYPNPTDGILNLNSIDNIEKVSLYNLLGQLVVENKVDATSSQIDISNLATGTYLMKVSVNGQIGTYRVLKQ